MADALAQYSFVEVKAFLSDEEVQGLLKLIHHHQNEDNFHAAGVGRADEFAVNRNIRGDYIKWIDPQSVHPEAEKLVSRIEKLKSDLNRLLFLSMVDIECHFAVYPPGAFYEKHLDQFRGRNFRKLSFVIYLNPEWQPADGGELLLYRDSKILSISPLAGKLVVFRSDEVEHEVALTNKPRYSITGWMLDRPLDWPIV
mgnify:CR=1 FL=1